MIKHFRIYIVLLHLVAANIFYFFMEGSNPCVIQECPIDLAEKVYWIAGFIADTVIFALLFFTTAHRWGNWDRDLIIDRYVVVTYWVFMELYLWAEIAGLHYSNPSVVEVAGRGVVLLVIYLITNLAGKRIPCNFNE